MTQQAVGSGLLQWFKFIPPESLSIPALSSPSLVLPSSLTLSRRCTFHLYSSPTAVPGHKCETCDVLKVPSCRGSSSNPPLASVNMPPCIISDLGPKHQRNVHGKAPAFGSVQPDRLDAYFIIAADSRPFFYASEPYVWFFCSV